MADKRRNKLLEIVRNNNISSLAIVGLAKNAGKTVALNAIIRETEEYGCRTAVASYGRDGEDTDAITLKEKPHIFIPPETFFVTSEGMFEKSGLQASVVAEIQDNPLLGMVSIYRNGPEGGDVELLGVNSSSVVLKIKKLLPPEVELFLIDGALDRRSSAVPSLTRGMILATGAVIGNTVELIARRTIDEIERLTLPACPAGRRRLAAEILDSGKSGLIRDGKIFAAGTNLFDQTQSLDFSKMEELDTLVLNGALTDKFAESLVFKYKIKNCTLIVRDGTRVFLNKRNMNLLKTQGITLLVFNEIRLLAVTVNPYSPYGFRADSDLLVERIKDDLEATGMQIPVVDVLSGSYAGMK